MILYIAEKPSLGRAIASALPGPQRKAEGCIHVGNSASGESQVVSWCIGHLLEQAEPDAYDPAYRQWRLEHLPIVPDNWQLQPRKGTRRQLSLLKKLAKEASEIVHAGDPDREGQLLVDELLQHCRLSRATLAGVKRCLINDLNPKAVRAALQKLRDNTEFAALSTSALARSRADWLYGINMTRAYTLQGRRAGYDGVLSVGRVQTPVLGLVVRRDQEIENFVSKPFYEVWARLETDKQESFAARWVPSAACSDYLDEHKRNLSRALAENVARRITNQPASVKSVVRKTHRIPPPLPYNLSALQIDANRAFGFSAQKVLDICQSLYEQHKLITYPRSDCRYLPEDHLRDVRKTLDAIDNNLSGWQDDTFTKIQPALDSSRRSRCWNDKKVDAHHAIVPTQATQKSLPADHQRIYRLIARQYLAQFLEDHVYHETRVEVSIKTGLFVATAREPDVIGWKALIPDPTRPKHRNSKGNGSTLPTAAPTTSANARPEAVDGDKPGKAQEAPVLPKLHQGQALKSLVPEIRERNTSPPPPFTEATLLSAMTGISRFVKDPELKKVLRETDGLGTEATRAGIIELLFKRGFLTRSGKTVLSTEAGRALIQALPELATQPDMTARWESQLTAIREKQLPYQQLMDSLTGQLTELIRDCRNHPPAALSALKAIRPAAPATPKKRGRRKKKRASR